ncbi:hypothetical protein [Gordonia sp. NPDC003950]
MTGTELQSYSEVLVTKPHDEPPPEIALAIAAFRTAGDKLHVGVSWPTYGEESATWESLAATDRGLIYVSLHRPIGIWNGGNPPLGSRSEVADGRTSFTRWRDVTFEVRTVCPEPDLSAWLDVEITGDGGTVQIPRPD